MAVKLQKWVLCTLNIRGEVTFKKSMRKMMNPIIKYSAMYSQKIKEETLSKLPMIRYVMPGILN